MNDLRYAVRMLMKNPGFTTVAVLTLALGIGGNSIIFTGINAVLLRPLPLPDPDRVVFVRETIRESQNAGVTAPNFLDWQRDQRSFGHLAAYATTNMALTGRGEPERVSARRVSAHYFKVLGFQPLVGRDFTPADEPFGAAKTVVLSESVWRNRFEADAAIVGQALTLDGQAYTVIGVIPAAAQFTQPTRTRSALREQAGQIYVPLALTPAELGAPGSHFLSVIARLRPDVTVAQATAEMLGIAKRLQTVRPHSNEGFLATALLVHEALVGNVRRPLMMLFAAVGVILLIACVNVANLLLARSTGRAREMAIRTALGAGRARLVRQALTESLVLAALGGAFALVLTYWGAGLLQHVLPTDVPRLGDASLDTGVLAFTAMAAIGTGLLFGCLPAWHLARRDPYQGLQDSVRGATSPHRMRVGSTLVVVELACAVILLVGAGLLVRSFARLGAVDPGFQPQGLLAARLSLPAVQYPDPERIGQFVQIATERLGALPGVTSAAASSHLPLREPGIRLYAQIQDRPLRRDAITMFFYRAVTPDYFRTLGIPLVGGRTFTSDDRAGHVRVGVINETAAKRYWPNEDPIGQRLTTDDLSPTPAVVVGVVRDTKHFSLAEDSQPELFISHSQTSPSFWRFSQRSMSFVVRADANAAALSSSVREAIQQIDPTVPLYAVGTMEQALGTSMTTPRRYMGLVTAFGAIALLLAGIGLYGVMAFNVRQRVHEIGVRIALGAARRDVMGLILGRAFVLCVAGIALGLVGALSVSSLLANLLFDIQPTDRPTYIAVAGVLLAVGLLATYVPVRRAMAVDPVRALRAE